MVEFGGGAAFQVSETGRFVMEALGAAVIPEGADDAGEVLVSEWAEAEAIQCNGHRLRRAGLAVFCEVCVAWSAGGVSKQVLADCCGIPSGERKGETFLSNLDSRRRRLLKGLHPEDNVELTFPAVPRGGLVKVSASAA
ncbi:unnamed protein product [Prorocentrum cordatum]|uniref:Uncharacterized protein n=1 Tax=Prorocentrum cordatum TaxID=2364126 RepID=A0ABN9T146_9DINO|nr:unnamed protein product [Polarella glacialis]